MSEMLDYFDDSVSHRKSHKCGGYPFEHGAFLSEVVRKTNALSVLEIGTAIGYSSYCLALGNQNAKITTIDFHEEHLEIAKKKWKSLLVKEQITSLYGKSEDVCLDLVNNDQKFDLVFFDAFSPNPDEVGNYIALLKEGGILITTNLELPSEIYRVEEYLAKIKELGLETIRYGDICFSSKSPGKLDICETAWKNHVQ